MKFKSAGALATLTLLLVVAAMSGCSKPASVSAQPTDAQVAGDVQTKISSDPTLSGKQIAINADKGVVTLSGTVDSDAQVTSALNDAQQAQGVKQVISKLAVQTVAATPEPAPPSTPTPEPRYQSSSRAGSSHGHSRHSLPSSSSSYSNSEGTSTTTASNSGSDNSAPAYTPPPPPPPPSKVTVAAGTVLQVRTVEGLSSETNHEADTWHGTLNSDIMVDDQTVIPAGAEVQGRVMEAHAATHYTGGASLVLGLERISFNGQTYQVATDTWERKGDTRGKNTVEKTAGGAAVGAILGGIFGGGKGAAIGSVAGAGAGAGANTITKGQKVELRPETLVSFRLQNPISVMPSATTGRHGTVIRPDNSSDQPQ
jgi:hypothetical protein